MRTASNLSFIPLQAKRVGIKLKKKSAYPRTWCKEFVCLFVWLSVCLSVWLSVCNQYVSKKISPLVARPVFFHPFYHVCLKKWWNGFIATVFSDWSQIFNPDLYYLQEVRNFRQKFHLYLFISVPSVEIEGSRDLHAQAGSSVILKCLIRRALQKPREVTW